MALVGPKHQWSTVDLRGRMGRSINSLIKKEWYDDDNVQPVLIAISTYCIWRSVSFWHSEIDHPSTPLKFRQHPVYSSISFQLKWVQTKSQKWFNKKHKTLILTPNLEGSCSRLIPLQILGLQLKEYHLHDVEPMGIIYGSSLVGLVTLWQPKMVFHKQTISYWFVMVI
jgi:hypothetical protein